MEFETSAKPNYGDLISQVQSDSRAVFSTYNNDYGIVPEPRPSSELRPSWDSDDLDAPIEDALNEGWICRLPARAEVNSELTDERVEWRTKFKRDVVSTHPPQQMGDFNVPIDIVKLHSYWTAHLPDGYSALITQPIGRFHPNFTPFSGCIDFDNFPTITHTPTLWEQRDHVVLPEGTPTLQLIPFKRDDMIVEARVRTASDEEVEALDSDKGGRADREPLTTSVEIEEV